jgi:uncharacterized coiled-coil protein SlyX
MDSLVSLMQSIDLISKSIPEGEYLKMCNDMKDIYKVIPRPTSPGAHLPRINAPRALPESDTESDDDDDDDFRLETRFVVERHELERLVNFIREYEEEIKRVQSRLRYLKIKQRITAGVRKDAVRERAQQLGFRLREFTIEELRAKGHHVPDERSFYKNYLERQNLITRDVINDLNDDLAELTHARDESTRRRAELQNIILGTIVI